MEYRFHRFLADFCFHQNHAGVSDFCVGGNGDAIGIGVRTFQGPPQFPVAFHQGFHHSRLFRPSQGLHAKTGELHHNFFPQPGAGGVHKVKVEDILQAPILGHRFVDNGSGFIKLHRLPRFGIHPLSLFIPCGAIEKPSGPGRIEVLIAANGHRRQGPGLRVLILGEVKTFNPEGNLTAYIVHKALHRSNGNALVGYGQNFTGFVLLGLLCLFCLVLQDHRQAGFFRLLFYLLGGAISALRLPGPPGKDRRSGKGCHCQGCRQGNHQQFPGRMFFLIHGLLLSLGGQPPHHSGFRLRRKGNGIHGLFQFLPHISSHCVSPPLSDMSAASAVPGKGTD